VAGVAASATSPAWRPTSWMRAAGCFFSAMASPHAHAIRVRQHAAPRIKSAGAKRDITRRRDLRSAIRCTARRCPHARAARQVRRRGALLGVMHLSAGQSRTPSTVAHPLTRPGIRHCWPGRVKPRLVRKKDLDFRTTRDVTPPGLPTTSTLRGASRCSVAGPSPAQLRAMAR
jgi:hypothetical protein